MILNGDISMGHARVLSKIDDGYEIERLAKKITEENISVHELENISKNEEIKSAKKKLLEKI